MISATAAQNIVANASPGNCSTSTEPKYDKGKATIGSPIRLLGTQAGVSIPTPPPSEPTAH